MELEEYRVKLTALRKENDVLIGEIKSKLETYAKAHPNKNWFKRKEPTAAGRLAGIFSERQELVSKIIRCKGEKYFEERIEEEKAFSVFAGEILEILKTLERASEGKGKEAAETQARQLEALTTKTDAWLKNKTNTWREDMVQESATVLKEQTVEMLEQTMEDLKLFAEGCEMTDTVEGQESAKLALAVRAELESCKGIIQGSYVMDTDGNYRLVYGIREKVEKIRKELPKIASERPVKSALADIAKLTEAIKKEKNEGRKLTFNKKIHSFAVATEESLLKRTKIDELAAAVFVIERVTVNKDFFDAMDARIERMLKSLGDTQDFANDPAYVTMKNNAALYAKEIKKMKADPKCSQARLVQYVQLLKATDTQIKEFEKTKVKEVQSAVEKAKDISRLRKTCESFKDVAKIFTSESDVSYRERAQIMAETQVYDFRRMYEDYVSAMLNGDKETLGDIRAKLKAMVEEFNTRRGRDILDQYDEAEYQQEIQDFDVDAELATLGVSIDEDELGALLGEYGEEETAEEEVAVAAEKPARMRETENGKPAAIPGSGEAAVVNTTPYANDELSKTIQNFLDDIDAE